jgi:hypothetical protein
MMGRGKLVSSHLSSTRNREKISVDEGLAALGLRRLSP